MASLGIEWLGLSTLKLTVKQNVGEVVLLTDPFGPEEGIKMTRGITADIVVLSNEPKNKVSDLVGGSPFVIKNPGEYEAKGVFVYGLGAEVEREKGGKKVSEKITLYRFEAEDFTIGYLDGLNRLPTDAEYDFFTEVDLLFLPVGGQGVLTAREAAAVMTRIEPRVVVPTFFRVPNLVRELDPVEKFVKEAGIVPEKVEKLRLAKKDLPQEETKLFILTP